MPSERVLGRSFKIRASGVMRDVNECCYDIPLLKSLESLLNNRCVLDQVCTIEMKVYYYLFAIEFQVLNLHKLEDERIGDYCDGQQFKEHALFMEDPCALQIRIYYDDVEICNALGSKTKKHKLGKLSESKSSVINDCVQVYFTILWEILNLSTDPCVMQYNCLLW